MHPSAPAFIELNNALQVTNETSRSFETRETAKLRRIIEQQAAELEQSRNATIAALPLPSFRKPALSPASRRTTAV